MTKKLNPILTASWVSSDIDSRALFWTHAAHCRTEIFIVIVRVHAYADIRGFRIVAIDSARIAEPVRSPIVRIYTCGR